jgi:hypothetical protein
MKRRAICTAIVCGLWFGAIRTAGALTVISVGSYTVPATPLTPFLVPIVITGASNVDFWQFSLTYDPTDVRINDPAALDPLGRPVTEGEFFSGLSPFNVFNPGFIILNNFTLDQVGLLEDVNDTFGGTLPGPSGNGVLAYVEFVALGDGDSPIQVIDSKATSSVPEPSAFFLLASGVGALGMCRLRRQERRSVSIRRGMG